MARVARKKKGEKKKKKGREFFIVRYLKETRAELRKVTWPTRREALNLTLIVLAITLFMAALLGLIDYVFTKLFDLIM